MRIQTGTIFLILICVALIGALLWNNRHAGDRQQANEVSLGNYSNKWVETSASLEEQRQVNTSLGGDFKKQQQEFADLTNAYARVAAALAQTETALKSAREDIARRDARIANLESQNQALNQRALDLSRVISNLTAQIEDTQRKLAAAEGVKPLLEWDPADPPAAK